jgi:hypothetical protein
MVLISLTWLLTLWLKIVRIKWKADIMPFTKIYITKYAFLHVCLFMSFDLYFDPRWPIFKPEIVIIQTTFLANLKDIWAKNITRFLHFLMCVNKFLTPDDPCSNLLEIIKTFFWRFYVLIYLGWKYVL